MACSITIRKPDIILLSSFCLYVNGDFLLFLWGMATILAFFIIFLIPWYPLSTQIVTCFGICSSNWVFFSWVRSWHLPSFVGDINRILLFSSLTIVFFRVCFFCLPEYLYRFIFGIWWSLYTSLRPINKNIRRPVAKLSMA